jgi:hypothetical protein
MKRGIALSALPGIMLQRVTRFVPPVQAANTWKMQPLLHQPMTQRLIALIVVLASTLHQALVHVLSAHLGVMLLQKVVRLVLPVMLANT